MPIGPTAKVRSLVAAQSMKYYLESIGNLFGVHISAVFTEGLQPVGRGIGPALEAKDVLNVLQGHVKAPIALRERALLLASQVLEYSPHIKKGEGLAEATRILDSGLAWKKFQAICHAQGGLFEPPDAPYTHVYTAPHEGMVSTIDNRYIARLAKLAGAPQAKTAGLEMNVMLGQHVEKDEPLVVVHAQTRGELEYAKQYLQQTQNIITIQEEK
jgi:thymidine phosphorylase